MPPFQNFTTKAKEAIRRGHEHAIERGQNHVNPIHLLVALLMQEDSMVVSILEKLEVDTNLFLESLLDSLESPESATVGPPLAYRKLLSAAPRPPTPQDPSFP